MEKLPLDIILEFLSLLSKKEWINIRCVNKHLRKIIDLHVLDVIVALPEKDFHPVDALIRSLEQKGSLFAGFAIADAALSKITETQRNELKKIRALSFYGNSGNFVFSLPNLTSLHLTDNTFEFSKLATLTSIQHLRVGTMRALPYLPPHLVSLRAVCKIFDFSSFPRSLRKLEIRSITGNPLSLNGIPEGLTSLKIENTIVKGKNISFAICKNLKNLVLKDCELEFVEFPVHLRKLEVHRCFMPLDLKRLTQLECFTCYGSLPDYLPISINELHTSTNIRKEVYTTLKNLIIFEGKVIP